MYTVLALDRWEESGEKLPTAKPAARFEWMVKQLLPKVHHFDKGFNEQTNEITFTATYDGVKIVLKYILLVVVLFHEEREVILFGLFHVDDNIP